MSTEDFACDREADPETAYQVFEQRAIGCREDAYQQERGRDPCQRRLREQHATTAQRYRRAVDDFSHRNMVTGTAGPMIEADADKGAGVRWR
jgi:hypothetical protein